MRIQLQRRHYELIAEGVRRGRDAANLSTAQLEHVAQSFALILRCTNPNFDEARFLAACGVNKPASPFD